jgi:hypothetical protein
MTDENKKTDITPMDDGHEEYEEKPKRKSKEGKVEWAFDFAELGEGIKSFFNSLAGDENLVESVFEVQRDGETQALRVKVDFSVGKGTFQALPAGGQLFHANVHHVGEMEFLTSGTDTKRITLRQKKPTSIAAPIRQGFRAIADRNDLRWDVGIAPDVPVALDIEGGVGPITLDMTGLRVRSADVESGVGTMDIILPSQAEPMRLDLDSGVGETNISVPAGVHGEIDIEAGVGQVNITVTPNTALRLKAERGIGSISVPKHLVEVKDKVWQTEGYDLAERKLFVKYEGGVGSFKLKVADVV